MSISPDDQLVAIGWTTTQVRKVSHLGDSDEGRWGDGGKEIKQSHPLIRSCLVPHVPLALLPRRKEVRIRRVLA